MDVLQTLLPAALALSSCASTDTASAVQDKTRATADELARTELPEDWETSPVLAFERAVIAWPGGVLSAENMAALAAALSRQDESSVRAAVLLGRSGDPAARTVLIERLEARVPAPSRPYDAGDVVAAASLLGAEEGTPRRLEALVVGPRPHPDLEVRIECARTALFSGREAVIPWLLSVLRVMTHDEALDPPDWERTQRMAWAKHRAADALAGYAGVPNTFRPDGSVEHQENEARHLEELLSTNQPRGR